VEPTIKFAGDDGSTLIEVNNFTVNGTDVLAMPSKLAIILAVPMPTLVTKPVAEIVAVFVLSLAHITREFMLFFEPSEYVPVALSCTLEPTFKIVSEAGVTEIEDNDGFGPDEQAATHKIKHVISPQSR